MSSSGAAVITRTVRPSRPLRGPTAPTAMPMPPRVPVDTTTRRLPRRRVMIPCRAVPARTTAAVATRRRASTSRRLSPGSPARWRRGTLRPAGRLWIRPPRPGPPPWLSSGFASPVTRRPTPGGDIASASGRRCGSSRASARVVRSLRARKGAIDSESTAPLLMPVGMCADFRSRSDRTTLTESASPASVCGVLPSSGGDRTFPSIIPVRSEGGRA
jgi:hypothetical protein